MKKLQHKRIILLAAVCLTTAIQAFAQSPIGYVSQYGLKDNIEEYYDTITGFIKYDTLDILGKRHRVHGIDDLRIGKLDGHHWTGDILTTGENKKGVYFVNMKTGEYLMWADEWGTTPITDYNGTMFDMVCGYTCRADSTPELESYQAAGTTPDGVTKAARIRKGYQLRMSYNPERVVGRKQTRTGAVGTFEKIPLMVARSRDKKEYANHPDDSGDPGHFVFHFYPVKKNDGKQYYVIYTHRQTTAGIHDQFYINNGMKGWVTNPETGEQELVITNLEKYNRRKRLIEFDNRDSYLCLRSQKSDVAEYNVVAYKKFAGQMWYDLSKDTKYYWERYLGKDLSGPDHTAHQDLLPSPQERTYFSQDEIDYMMKVEGDSDKRFVSLANGLDTVALDSACLWKIVTFEERKKYRVSANIDKPFDVSFNIDNHGFFPFRSPYEKTNADDSQPTRFGWTWHNNDKTDISHNHPYNATNFNYDSEFHKIGTHFYDRWGFCKSTDDVALYGNSLNAGARSDERLMTQGMESDYVASIYKGSAALSQTITGLRPGRYIVYCRAFYAPHNMVKFDNRQAFSTREKTYDSYEDEDEEGNPIIVNYFTGYNVTYDKLPTWDNNTSIPNTSIPKAVTDSIDKQPMSSKSFFYAISKPDGETSVERKRKLPSIYSGMMEVSAEKMEGMSKESFLFDRDALVYTPFGDALYSDEYTSEVVDEYGQTIPAWERLNEGSYAKNKYVFRLMQDSTVFALIPYDNKTYFVPRNLAGAARFFASTDTINHPEAQMYRIGLPVEVGEDGELTIGIDHTATVGNEEWVCFDDFSLIYYGDRNSWDFVIDESSPQNCTRYHDLFDWEESYTLASSRPSTASFRNSRVAIKRNLSQERFTPIVLPISLTRQQVRDAFGDDVKISEPSHITYKTIHFSAVSTDISSDADKKIVAMEAYKPYIVKPSMAPPVGSGETWDRTRFIRADDNSFGWDDGTFNYYIKNMNPKDSVFVPKAGRNHQINQNKDGIFKDIPGPLYFVDGYKIDKAVHYQNPLPTDEYNHFTGKNPVNDKWDYTQSWYNAAYQWNPVGDVYVGDERMQIKGSTDGKAYQLRATCYYDPTDTTGMNKKVPPYSYFFSGGNLKFNGKAGSTQSKGFSFYLQIVESEPLETANIITWNTSTDSAAPNGTYTEKGSDNYYKVFTTNAASGVEGVVIRADYNAMGKANYGGMRHFAIQASEANMAAPKTFTITAPAGYKIDGYKIGAYCKDNSQETYTLTAEGGKSVTINSNVSTSVEPTYLEVKRLDVASTSFTFQNVTSGTKQWMAIPHFEIRLRKIPEGGSAKVFAGSVGDFEWVPVADGEVTGVTETFREYENPANDLYYDLQGRPVKTPKKNGIYIYRGKKIVY